MRGEVANESHSNLGGAWFPAVLTEALVGATLVSLDLGSASRAWSQEGFGAHDPRAGMSPASAAHAGTF